MDKAEAERIWNGYRDYIGQKFDKDKNFEDLNRDNETKIRGGIIAGVLLLIFSIIPLIAMIGGSGIGFFFFFLFISISLWQLGDYVGVTQTKIRDVQKVYREQKIDEVAAQYPELIPSGDITKWQAKNYFN
jgi:hypothetical protein